MNTYTYTGIEGAEICTLNDIPVASKFNRILLGGRGCYIEFLKDEMYVRNIQVPSSELWRYDSATAYYVELRTKDGVKVYWQKRMVRYADYWPGRYYISPVYLKDFTINGKYVMEGLNATTQTNQKSAN